MVVVSGKDQAVQTRGEKPNKQTKNNVHLPPIYT